MKIVILAGGVGQRLWPVSRTNAPKQTKPFIGDRTLLQKTVDRLRKGFRKEDILISTGRAHAATILRQLPGFSKAQIIAEPDRRGTAAAIGYVAYLIARKNPREIIVTLPSDHFIREEDVFLRGLHSIERVIQARPKAVCLMGIHPTYPETGLGYIEAGASVRGVRGVKLYTVRRFVEKPPLAQARRFVDSGRYYWNASYFGWRVDRVQELFATFIPKTHALLTRAAAGETRAFARIDCPAVDYAIMEKLHEDLYVVPGDFHWADIGHWASVREIQAKDTKDNVLFGLQHIVDTEGSLVYNYTQKILGVVGLKDVLVVQTDDGTLVCHRDRAQDVKKLVERMHEDRKLRKYL